ncbi:hypothetical protein [Ligilactobacillus sp. LYQ60]|uniref:hypothetical protein n=1 Tax=unclassified Ligilactobacillus TaxID=2767920 RepID=UPI003853C984
MKREAHYIQDRLIFWCLTTMILFAANILLQSQFLAWVVLMAVGWCVVLLVLWFLALIKK